MKTLSPREKMVLAAGGIFLAGYVFSVYVAAPVLQKQNRLEERIETKQYLIAKYFETLNREEHYKKKSETIDKLTHQLQHMLLVPEKPALAAAALQKIIEGLAKNLKVTVTQVKPQQAVERDALLGVPVRVHLRSDLKALSLFIRELEINPRFLVVDAIHLRRINKQEPEMLESDLLIEGFIHKQEMDG